MAPKQFPGVTWSWKFQSCEVLRFHSAIGEAWFDLIRVSSCWWTFMIFMGKFKQEWLSRHVDECNHCPAFLTVCNCRQAAVPSGGCSSVRACSWRRLRRGWRGRRGRGRWPRWRGADRRPAQTASTGSRASWRRSRAVQPGSTWAPGFSPGCWTGPPRRCSSPPVASAPLRRQSPLPSRFKFSVSWTGLPSFISSILIKRLFEIQSGHNMLLLSSDLAI